MAAVATTAPPPEAMRRGVSRGVFVATVVIVAIIAVSAGLYVGKTVLGSTSSTTSYNYLVVGTNIPFPPFEDYNYTSGAYFGFDIDFSQLIANALNRTLIVNNYASFSSLLVVVGTGVVDMGAAAITMSGSVGAARNATMSFSAPYYDANQVILVRSGSALQCPASGCTVQNLSSLKIGVQTGTSSDIWCSAYLAPNETGGSVAEYTTIDLEVTALTLGALDAVMIDTGPGNYIVAGSGGVLKAAGSIFTDEMYGFAVAHNDPEHILPVINHVINQAMQNGTYAKLIKEWFG